MKYLSAYYIYKKGERIFMGKKFIGCAVNFLVRAIIGLGIIFFVNKYLDYRNINVSVGLNEISFLTSGFLGIPGVFLLYGILFYGIL